ncbi:unnamed protein product [Pleuronectes platessa]|uniref:Uncharacterized protein n=1 Tax=Pleuronectes platessa TaxID=8262 RepID=A0A9N7V936_PLEPL|nr:unnamed protein product [Pleuronectes platessa]
MTVSGCRKHDHVIYAAELKPHFLPLPAAPSCATSRRNDAILNVSPPHRADLALLRGDAVLSTGLEENSSACQYKPCLPLQGLIALLCHMKTLGNEAILDTNAGTYVDNIIMSQRFT